MIQEVPTTQAPASLNDKVVSILRSASTLQEYEKLMKEAGIQDPNPAFLGLEVFRLVRGKKDGAQFIQTLKDELGLSGIQARTLAIVLSSDILLPLSDDLSIPLRAMIKEWGSHADPGESLPLDTYVRAYACSVSSLQDDRMRHRFASILLSYVKKERSKERVFECS